jgi:hypothetical protein
MISRPFLKAYWRVSGNSDEGLKVSALRWLRGELSTKTEARQALDVRTIIDDDSVYDSLKSLACLTKVAGYAGLLVMFDEMVNFYKLQSSQSRNQNFEQILRIVNDSLQGNTVNIGFVMCGTPEFLMDTRRGCTATKRFSRDWPSGGLVDLSGPIIKLQSLTPEELARALWARRNGDVVSGIASMARMVISRLRRQRRVSERIKPRRAPRRLRLQPPSLAGCTFNQAIEVVARGCIQTTSPRLM